MRANLASHYRNALCQKNQNIVLGYTYLNICNTLKSSYECLFTTKEEFESTIFVNMRCSC